MSIKNVKMLKNIYKSAITDESIKTFLMSHCRKRRLSFIAAIVQWI